MSTVPMRETGYALKAFNEYLQLPHPRRLGEMAGKPNCKGKPYSLASLRQWSATFKWKDRADAFDRELAEAEMERIRKEREREIARRERRRLLAYDHLSTMAMEMLTYPDDWPEVEKRGKPVQMESKDPAFLSLALQYIKEAFAGERLDLGLATSRHENLGQGGADAQRTLNQVVVVTPEGLDELRGLVGQLQVAAPKTQAAKAMEEITSEEPIVEGELVGATS